jgi:hypothetical protein
MNSLLPGPVPRTCRDLVSYPYPSLTPSTAYREGDFTDPRGRVGLMDDPGFWILTSGMERDYDSGQGTSNHFLLCFNMSKCVSQEFMTLSRVILRDG